MEFLSLFLVGHPFHILLVGGAALAVQDLARRGLYRSPPSGRSRFVLAILWAAYAGWEWLVLTRTPEANIRVDLLVIWPALSLATLILIFRRRKNPT